MGWARTRRSTAVLGKFLYSLAKQYIIIISQATQWKKNFAINTDLIQQDRKSFSTVVSQRMKEINEQSWI